MMALVYLALLVAPALAAITEELNCTQYTTEFVYTPAATICPNIISDSSCEVLYPAAVTADGYPRPGGNAQRPYKCYSTGATGGALNLDMKRVALENCPRTCGLCCQTSAYNCRNVNYPRLNCATITQSQCLSATWRVIIAQDCPSSCGFCNQGGCVDGVLDCANDISICNAVGMQDFVNTYCQKTCARCASSTTASSSVVSTCTSYIADSSTSCRAWALNGFCTNTFYTAAQRRSYCATTCRIC